jgi:polyisoprenoid-binding protein YceI
MDCPHRGELHEALSDRGVTRPLTLAVHSLKCVPPPMLKRDYCNAGNADASGILNRDEFGLGAGKDCGFKMNGDLRFQVKAIAQP